MKCEVCGTGERRAQSIDYHLRVGDKLIVVEGVPAVVCTHCGETSLSPDTVEQLQQTIWQGRRPSRVLETPVYEFPSAATPADGR